MCVCGPVDSANEQQGADCFLSAMVGHDSGVILKGVFRGDNSGMGASDHLISEETHVMMEHQQRNSFRV